MKRIYQHIISTCRPAALSLSALLAGFSQSAIAQQSFFNVPSSDITPKYKLFFQQQTSLYKDGIQSNTTFSYGLGHNWEVGVNALGVSYENGDGFVFNDYSKPYSPLLAVNGQKKVVFSDKFSVGTGFQGGVNRMGKGGAYLYSNAVYLNEHTHTKLVGGLYTSTDGYFGSETRNWIYDHALTYVGLQAGIEQNIWKERLVFQTDYISGEHALGQIVFGGAYYVSKKWVVSSGLQLATFRSKALDELVFELTYVPG